MRKNRYIAGFDIIDKKNTSIGTFVIWDRLSNTPNKIIETRLVKLYMFWFWLKGIKVIKEEN